MIRAVALALALAPAVQAQEMPVFDPDAPYFVQQVMAEKVLLESAGRQFLCEMDVQSNDTQGPDVVLPVDCMLFGTPGDTLLPLTTGSAASDSETDDTARSQDISDAGSLIENMPPPAFQAALLSVFNDMGCVIDFSNVAETQAEIIAQTGAALGFTLEVTDAINDALDDRIGSEIDAMESRFEIDETAQVATLVDGCVE